MTDGRPIIAKTGTTDNAHSAFFIGAIPQYALTVGIFTEKQSDQNQTLNGLGGNVGGGFGGYWPARIWHTFAEDEFAQPAHPAVPDAAVHRHGLEHAQRGHDARRHARPQQADQEARSHAAAGDAPDAPGHQPVPDPDGAAHLRPAAGHAL